MATDILLVSDFEQFKGEASRHGQKNAIDVQSFTFGASRISQYGGHSERRAPAFTTLDVTAAVDTGTARLLSIFSTNEEIPEIALMQFRAGGDDDVVLWKMTMRNALVDSVKFSGGEGASPAICSFSLSYRKVDFEALPQSGAGQQGASVFVAIDLTVAK